MKNFIRFFNATNTVLISLLLFSCVTNDSDTTTANSEPPERYLTTIQTIHTAIPSGTNITTEYVKGAILQATNRCRWILEQEQKDFYIFKLVKRKYMVKIKISYSQSEYNIEYVDSENMYHNKETNTIHQSYMRWINKLNKYLYKSIIKEVSKDLKQTNSKDTTQKQSPTTKTPESKNTNRPELKTQEKN